MVSPGATVGGLLTEYCTVLLRSRETATRYIDWVGILEKQLLSVGENFKELGKIRTISQRLPDTYLTTRNLISELKKNRREFIAMITTKEAELKSGSSKLGLSLAKYSQTEKGYISRDSHLC